MDFDKDIITLATSLLEAARQRSLQIVTAESCTGGLVSSALTSISGSSDVFDRGFVTYTNEAKHQMLDVSTNSLEKYGAVSEAVAKEMAYGALVNSMADIAVSITGIAGPTGGSEEKPVGTVYFGLCFMGDAPQCFKKSFENADRNEVRRLSIIYALSIMLEMIAS
ncbi:CinA family protein [Kordiimonas pumila]|uniref:CinA family protein n=1 Tax=Kordiimonas pumila TaxID=2161677 RepID=A0ABV7D2K0_9PROT|nr:CinA family protein [Kordiimonas pumila]